MQTISVDSKELNELSRKVKEEEKVDETESEKEERQKLDNEILSLIGNINMKALQIKNQMGFNEKKKD